MGNFFAQVGFHQEYPGDLLTWPVQDSGYQRVLTVFQLCPLPRLVSDVECKLTGAIFHSKLVQQQGEHLQGSHGAVDPHVGHGPVCRSKHGGLVVVKVPIDGESVSPDPLGLTGDAASGPLYHTGRVALGPHQLWGLLVLLQGL